MKFKFSRSIILVVQSTVWLFVLDGMLVPLDLINGLTLPCYQPSPEVEILWY